MTMRPAYIVFSLMTMTISAVLAACSSKDDAAGHIENFSVTGTDGSTTDPATVSATQGAGQFSVNYSVSPSTDTELTISVRSASGEQIALYDNCCPSSGCGASQLSCTYDATGGVTCAGKRTDLSTYFQRNGGIPNLSKMVIDTATDACSTGINSAHPTRHSANWGVIFR